MYLVKDKTRGAGISTLTESMIITICYGLTFILDQKNKSYTLEKVNDRIPILQLTRSGSKRQKETDAERWF